MSIEDDKPYFQINSPADAFSAYCQSQVHTLPKAQVDEALYQAAVDLVLEKLALLQTQSKPFNV